MKNAAIAKINKMGKAGAVLALITKILLGIALAACLIGLIATLVLPKDLVRVEMKGVADVMIDASVFGEGIFNLPEEEKQQISENVKKSSQIQYAGNHFEVSDIELQDSSMKITAGANLLSGFSMRSCSWALAAAILNLVLLFVSVVFAGRLAKAFRDCVSPFEENVIRRMKAFAYSLIPWAVISGFTGYFQKRIWMSGSTGIDFSIDITVVVVVLVILALSYIFQYGAVLQRESDETL